MSPCLMRLRLMVTWAILLLLLGACLWWWKR